MTSETDGGQRDCGISLVHSNFSALARFFRLIWVIPIPSTHVSCLIFRINLICPFAGSINPIALLSQKSGNRLLDGSFFGAVSRHCVSKVLLARFRDLISSGVVWGNANVRLRKIGERESFCLASATSVCYLFSSYCVKGRFIH